MSLELSELLCRVCLQQNELMLDINEQVEIDELHTNLSSLLDKLGGINIKLDPSTNYPKYLCQECTNELLISVRFQKKCADTEKLLKKQIEIITIDPSAYKESQTTAEPAQLSCDKCGAVFQQALTHQRHMEKVHGALKIDKQSYSQNEPSQRRHRCLHCGKCLQSPSSLVMHLRTHSGERPFACDVCPKSFKTQGALVTHQKRHKQVLQHECPHCQKSFVESSNLKRHIQGRHTDDRPHTCSVCHRKFSRVYLLELHTRTHTGDRPYTCAHCNRQFAQLSVLRNHERIHTGEKLHACGVCAKTFSRRDQLKKHALSHQPEFGLK